MINIYQFEGYISSSFHRILVTTGRAKTTMATERNKLCIATFGTGVLSTAKRWIATVDHLFNILNNSWTRVEDVYHLFIVI